MCIRDRIKIADIGLSEDVYTKNYFRQSGSDKSNFLSSGWRLRVSQMEYSQRSQTWWVSVTYW